MKKSDAKIKFYDKNWHDAGLIKMYLDMSVEERIIANDNAVNMILEVRESLKENGKKS